MTAPAASPARIAASSPNQSEPGPAAARPPQGDRDLHRAVQRLHRAAAGLTHDPVAFSVMRFLAGLGIGGVMPNVVAHMTEYAPKRIRARWSR